jgi:hypothetical protein
MSKILEEAINHIVKWANESEDLELIKSPYSSRLTLKYKDKIYNKIKYIIHYIKKYKINF